MTCVFKNDAKRDNKKKYVPIPLIALPTSDVGETGSISVKAISALFVVYRYIQQLVPDLQYLIVIHRTKFMLCAFKLRMKEDVHGIHTHARFGDLDLVFENV